MFYPEKTVDPNNNIKADKKIAQLISIPYPRPDADLRLYCFPYAGGSMVTFMAWQKLLPKTIELAIITLPGRGGRMLEPSYDTMEEIVADLACAFRQIHLETKPFAFFGHSMGARIGFELCHALNGSGLRLPSHFFASGSIAPTTTQERPPIHQLSDTDFIEALVKINNTSKEILENSELAELILPSLRIDFKIVETYFKQSLCELPTTVSVFAGTRDNEALDLKLAQWENLFQYSTGIHKFDGGHFFVDTCPVDVTKKLLELIA